MSRKTALYRHFDKDGALLYVGISLSAVQRLSDHSRNAPWAERITHVTVEWHNGRAEALAAEQVAIMSERPAHNVVHNRGAEPPRPPPIAPVLPEYVYTPEEVAVHLCMSASGVRSLVRRGLIPREHVDGRRYRYNLPAIDLLGRQAAERQLAERRAKRRQQNPRLEADRV